MNNKKIICTVGPASVKENIIKKMDESGVDLFRINLSHTDVEDFIPLVEKLRGWTNKPICPDTEGAQLRTSLLSNSKTVYEHEIIEFVNQSDLQDDGQIGILVGDYYEPDASFKYFDTLELDIKILSFNSVSFLKGKGLMEDATQSDSENKVEKISGSVIREQIMNNGDIPDYLMRSSIVKILKDWKNKDIETLFHP